MITGYIPLDYGDVALAATLLVLNAALSYALELRLERQLIIAALRMTVQLLLVGLVEAWRTAMSKSGSGALASCTVPPPLLVGSGSKGRPSRDLSAQSGLPSCTPQLTGRPATRQGKARA